MTARAKCIIRLMSVLTILALAPIVLSQGELFLGTAHAGVEGEGTQCTYGVTQCTEICEEGWDGTYNPTTQRCAVADDALDYCESGGGTNAQCFYDYWAPQDGWVRMFGQTSGYCPQTKSMSCNTCCPQSFQTCDTGINKMRYDAGPCPGSQG